MICGIIGSNRQREGRIGGQLTNITPILKVKKQPNRRNQRIRNRQPPIKRHLRHLRSRQFSVSIPKLHNRSVRISRSSVCANTIVASFLDWIVDGWRIVQVDGLGDDLRAGERGGVGGEDEGSQLGAVAEVVVDVFGVADELFLFWGEHIVSIRSYNVEIHKTGKSGIWSSADIGKVKGYM